MGEHFKEERPSLPQGVEPYTHSLQQAVWPYELRKDEGHRMWLPRPSELLGNGSLAGDVANLFAGIKRRLKRTFLGNEGVDA